MALTLQLSGSWKEINGFRRGARLFVTGTTTVIQTIAPQLRGGWRLVLLAEYGLEAKLIGRDVPGRNRRSADAEGIIPFTHRSTIG